jgi:hypothetical protein
MQASPRLVPAQSRYRRGNEKTCVNLRDAVAIRAVRKNLVPLKSPKTEVWLNAFDPRDIVALNPLDAANFPVVPEIENKGDVENFTDNHHGISGYLNNPLVARKIYQALGGGAS